MLSRREFIKGSVLGIAGLFLGKFLPKKRETSNWQSFVKPSFEEYFSGRYWQVESKREHQGLDLPNCPVEVRIGTFCG